jgi:hypothetical protein
VHRLAIFSSPVSACPLRRDGIACRIRVWGPRSSTAAAADLNLLLTEFPDPTAEAAYVLTPKPKAAVVDELYAP